MRGNEFKKLIPWGECTVSELSIDHSHRRHNDYTHGLSQFGVQSGMDEYVVYGRLEEIVEYAAVNKLKIRLEAPDQDKLNILSAEWDRIMKSLPRQLSNRYHYQNYERY